MRSIPRNKTFDSDKRIVESASTYDRIDAETLIQMKLLIAYDGSRCAEAAIDDLNRAGLPESGEGVVISVAEVWLPPAGEDDDIDTWHDALV